MRSIKAKTTYYRTQLHELVLNFKVYKWLILLLVKCCKSASKTRSYAVC